MNRLRIPRVVWWASAVAIVTFGGSFWIWSILVWTPVQRYFLAAYFRCSWPGADPASLLQIRWLYKTAPGAKPELASEDDAVKSSLKSRGGLKLELSPSARQAGWTSLIQGPEERIQIVALKPRLEDQVYDGQTLCLVVFWPLFSGFLAFYFLVLALNWLEDWLPDAPWGAERFSWEETSPSLLEKSVRRSRELRSRLSELHTHWTRKTTQARTVAAQPATATEPPATQAAAQFSPFGAKTGTYTEGFLWTEKDEIE